MGARARPVVIARVPAVAVAIAGAWLLIGAAQLTGSAGLLHHDALIEHGPPLWIGLPVFLIAWLVMVVAMMLPASLPAVAGYVPGSPPTARLVSFLGPYLMLWAAFGMAVFVGDLLVHRLVHLAPWLQARSWLIDASVIGFAGLYQVLPAKRRSLDACRHPGALRRTGRFGGLGAGFDRGLDHAAACIASSGGLMLLMFAEGFSSLFWMVALTALMAYEAVGRHGQIAGRIAGILLLGASLAVVVTARPL